MGLSDRILLLRVIIIDWGGTLNKMNAIYLKKKLRK